MHGTGLTLLALAGLTAAALSAVPYHSEPTYAAPRIDAPIAPETRIVLTPDQVKEAHSAGLLPQEARSILKVDKRMRHGEFVWNEQGIPSGPLLVRVNLQSQVISVFREGHEIGTAVILYGAEGHDTPIGTFPILTKIRDHRSSTYDAPMPFTLRLTTDGVAIHGSSVRWGAATHGCVGVPTEFARLLFEQAEVGGTVEIVAPTA